MSSSHPNTQETISSNFELSVLNIMSSPKRREIISLQILPQVSDPKYVANSTNVSGHTYGNKCLSHQYDWTELIS